MGKQGQGDELQLPVGKSKLNESSLNENEDWLFTSYKRIFLIL